MFKRRSIVNPKKDTKKNEDQTQIAPKLARRSSLAIFRSSSIFSIFSSSKKGKEPTPHLPPEIYFCIFQHLSASDLCKVSRVCSAWRELANFDRYWERLYHKKFGQQKNELVQIGSTPLKDWKSLFIDRVYQQKTSVLQTVGSGFKRCFGIWSFDTFAGNIAIIASTGKFYFEAEIVISGIIQVGFFSLQSYPRPSSGDGVGDDPYSWSWDGSRVIKFYNRTEERYGKRWSSGDVRKLKVGCLLDLTNSTVSFTLNGNDLGIAHSKSRFAHARAPFYGGCSVSKFSSGKVKLNYFKADMKYGPPAGAMAFGDGVDPSRFTVRIVKSDDQWRKVKKRELKKIGKSI